MARWIEVHAFFDVLGGNSRLKCALGPFPKAKHLFGYWLCHKLQHKLDWISLGWLKLTPGIAES